MESARRGTLPVLEGLAKDAIALHHIKVGSSVVASAESTMIILMKSLNLMEQL